jgi:starch synthase
MEGMEFHGQLSMLKAGLAFADRITTVSPTYAEEIKLAEFGYGMEGLLYARRRDLTGVLNGIDYDAWSPHCDPHISALYSAADIAGKARCKAALQNELGLASDTNAPLLAMVTRLTEQKGIDLVVAALPRLLAQGAQVAILGAGDAGWEKTLSELPFARERVATRIGYSEPLAHRFIAGADLFLMPSRFEPCGLTQMYAMRYGTLPIVRRTGGLADTVDEARILANGTVTGTGFLFDAPEPAALLEAASRGLELYADKPSWRLAQRNAMQQDFSWARSAEDYAWIYRVLAPHGEAGSDTMRGEAA